VEVKIVKKKNLQLNDSMCRFSMYYSQELKSESNRRIPTGSPAKKYPVRRIHIVPGN